MILTYQAYTEMGGRIPDEAAYTPYERQAALKAGYYTQGRIQKLEVIPECVQAAIFRLVELFWDFDNGANIKACANDGVSVTYADAPSLDAAALQIIRETLPPELTFRGVGA